MRYLLLLLALAGCAQDYELGQYSEPVMSPGDSLDVLYLIDTSCSMDDNVLAFYGLAQTGNELKSLNMDWQLAITNTSDQDEIFFKVPYSNDPGWQITNGIAQVQDGYSQLENGFAAAEWKYENNRDWFRNVPTLIVFVSDEHEQSTITAESFVANWPTPLYVVSIVGPYATTSLESQSLCGAEAAPKFHNAADFVIDICNSEPWSITDNMVSSP